MEKDDGEFLRELQKQCLKESTEYITELREGLKSIQTSPIECLKSLFKPCHSLKGNLQAVGYLHCGELLHRFETVLISIEKQVNEVKGSLSVTSNQFLEFLISEVVRAIEYYLDDLMRHQQDSPDLYRVREITIIMLEKWNPESHVGMQEKKEPESPIPLEQNPINSVPPIKTEPSPQVMSEKIFQAQSEQKAKIGQKKAEQDLRESKLYLLCKNGKHNFAIPVENVIEIIRARVWTPLPYDKPDLLGLVNLRGEVMPIVNIKDVIGYRHKDNQSNNGYIVVCQVNKGQFGLPVDEAEQVIEIQKGSLQDADQLEEENLPNVVKHIYFKDKNSILVVDVGQIVKA